MQSQLLLPTVVLHYPPSRRNIQKTPDLNMHPHAGCRACRLGLQETANSSPSTRTGLLMCLFEPGVQTSVGCCLAPVVPDPLSVAMALY